MQCVSILLRFLDLLFVNTILLQTVLQTLNLYSHYIS